MSDLLHLIEKSLDWAGCAFSQACHDNISLLGSVQSNLPVIIMLFSCSKNSYQHQSW